MKTIEMWWVEFKLWFADWWERHICGPDEWGED
jgi:hypothetical protein